jgi:hypothetical protein
MGIFAEYEASGKNLSFVCANVIIKYSDGRVSSPKLNFEGEVDHYTFLDGFAIRYQKPISSFPAIFSKTALEESGFNDVEMVEDVVIYLRALLHSNLYMMPDCVGVYRVHGDNLTWNMKVSFILAQLNEQRKVYEILSQRKALKNCEAWHNEHYVALVQHYVSSSKTEVSDTQTLREWGLKYAPSYNKATLPRYFKNFEINCDRCRNDCRDSQHPRNYPRRIIFFAGKFEAYLELSCEDAVKVVLLDKDALHIEETVLEPDERGCIIPNRILHADNYTSTADAVEIFVKLRMTSTAVMQSRQYTVRFRMLLLCLFIEQVDGLLAASQDLEVIKCADGFLEMLGAGLYDSLATEMPGGIDIDFGIALEIFCDMESKNDEQFNTCLTSSLKGLNLPPGSHELPAAFRDNYEEIYYRSFTGKEYLFENFIVNTILMDGFPFNYGKQARVLANYTDLLVKYNLIEILLVGTCAYHGGFEKQSIIDCVSAFSTCYDNTFKGFLIMK